MPSRLQCGPCPPRSCAPPAPRAWPTWPGRWRRGVGATQWPLTAWLRRCCIRWGGGGMLPVGGCAADGGHHHVWMDCVREGCGAHAIIPSTLPGRPDGSSGPVHDSLGVCAARARACRLLRAGARCGARQACTALPHGLHTSGDTIAIRPCHTSLTAHSLPALYLLASQLSVSNNDSGICVYQ